MGESREEKRREGKGREERRRGTNREEKRREGEVRRIGEARTDGPSCRQECLRSRQKLPGRRQEHHCVARSTPGSPEVRWCGGVVVWENTIGLSYAWKPVPQGVRCNPSRPSNRP